VRRNWFIWAIVVAVVSIAVAALIMRLTADDESSNPTTAAWADSVCTSLATWKSSITSLTDVSSGQLNADTLNQKIDEAQTATQTLVTELKDLGAPDLESGDALKQDLSSSADNLQSSFDSLKESANQASEASSPAEFLKGLTALAPQFQQLLGDVSATIDDLQNADIAASAKSELQSAFADAQSCQDLKSNG
jgi:uncharacterized membrane-anchored protein YhcB (DUF1043 family)